MPAEPSRGPVTITRRRFLATSALAVGAAVVGLRQAPALGRGFDFELPESAWSELARRLSGPLLRPGDAGFAAIAQPNNLTFSPVVPGGIARCQSAADVARSILWSREHDVPLVARGGGHSYAGYSTTRGLLLDLSPLGRIELDPATGIATVGGGTRNGALYRELRRFGVSITHGRCPGVGVGGFFLGGGIGFNMRARGMACDQLVGSELVTADGDVVILDADRNADLFWACRGGAGGNFGVNTVFRVQTFPVSDLTVFRIAWSSGGERLYAALLRALDPAPAGLGSRVQITARTTEEVAAGHDAGISVLGQLLGTPADLADILRPVYDVARPDAETIQVMDYWDAQINFLAESGPAGYYRERSRFFAGPLGEGAIATAFHWARRWPGTSKGAFLVLFQTGAAVNAPAPDATAFVHRNSSWLMTIALDWSEADALDVVGRNAEWQNTFYEAMLPFALPQSYQNFPDPALGDWLDAYYGSNLPRLERIKAQVDPTRVFRYPQGIPPNRQ